LSDELAVVPVAVSIPRSSDEPVVPETVPQMYSASLVYGEAPIAGRGEPASHAVGGERHGRVGRADPARERGSKTNEGVDEWQCITRTSARSNGAKRRCPSFNAVLLSWIRRNTASCSQCSPETGPADLRCPLFCIQPKRVRIGCSFSSVLGATMKFLRVFSSVLLIFSSAIWPIVPAYACSDHEYEACDPLKIACVCLPKADGDIANEFERVKREVRAQLGGPKIAAYIRQSRNDGINGSMPIPPNIRTALTGYVPEPTLDRARYKIQDNGALNLAHLTLLMGIGHPTAITLDDLIVFRDPGGATSVTLWAHELFHVDQYRLWGVDDFAKNYARNDNEVEDPAYASENGFMAWRTNAGPAFPGPPPPPPEYGSYCQTPSGRFGPGPTLMIGSRCWHNTAQGTIYGQIVQ
jgi:hypothetical protein